MDRLRRPMEGRLLDRSIDAIRRPCAVMRKDFLPTCQVQPWLQFHQAINMGRNPVDEIPSRIAGQLFTPKGWGGSCSGRILLLDIPLFSRSSRFFTPTVLILSRLTLNHSHLIIVIVGRLFRYGRRIIVVLW